MHIDSDHTFVHRDVKPQNIFINKRPNEPTTVKLGDLGISRHVFKPTKLSTIIGTPAYAAPEIFTSIDGYNSKVDVWSAGVLAYQLLTNRLPFADRHEGEAHVLPDDLDLIDREWSGLEGLIRGMLTVDPGERLSVEECLDLIEKLGKRPGGRRN